MPGARPDQFMSASAEGFDFHAQDFDIDYGIAKAPSGSSQGHETNSAVTIEFGSCPRDPGT